MAPIYLDHNATSPLDPEVFGAMRSHWLSGGNPESRHAAGRAARRALDRARETVARVLGADADEVVFTSGGTEANNLALFGLARSHPPGRLLTSPIEHPAVSEPVARLAAEGWAVDHLAVTAEGRAEVDAAVFAPETRLATLMLANNEVGTLQPVAHLARLAAVRGLAVHTDAVQAVGRVPVDFHALGVATLAASAHKLHGPMGVGVLLVRKGTALVPWLLGGGQQAGRRPGTVPVPLCAGLAAALEIWDRVQKARIARWHQLRDRLATGLLAALGPAAVIIQGPSDRDARLPQTLNVGFPELDGDALLMQLDLAGVCVSFGSACASGANTPSPTLVAMGIPEERLRSSVRFSLGATTTEADIDEALRRVVEVVPRITGPEAGEGGSD